MTIAVATPCQYPLLRGSHTVIDVLETESGFHCMCCGTPTFELYREEELLVSLGFHHGKSIRWPDGWPGDAKLTQSSSRFLVDWLSDKGFPADR